MTTSATEPSLPLPTNFGGGEPDEQTIEAIARACSFPFRPLFGPDYYPDLVGRKRHSIRYCDEIYNAVLALGRASHTLSYFSLRPIKPLSELAARALAFDLALARQMPNLFKLIYRMDPTPTIIHLEDKPEAIEKQLALVRKALDDLEEVLARRASEQTRKKARKAK